MARVNANNYTEVERLKAGGYEILVTQSPISGMCRILLKPPWSKTYMRLVSGIPCYTIASIWAERLKEKIENRL